MVRREVGGVELDHAADGPAEGLVRRLEPQPISPGAFHLKALADHELLADRLGLRLVAARRLRAGRRLARPPAPPRPPSSSAGSPRGCAARPAARARLAAARLGAPGSALSVPPRRRAAAAPAAPAPDRSAATPRAVVPPKDSRFPCSRGF